MSKPFEEEGYNRDASIVNPKGQGQLQAGKYSGKPRPAQPGEPFLTGEAMTGGYGKSGPNIIHDCTISVDRGEIAVIDKSPRRGVSVYGPDGKLKTKKVIDGLAKGDGSPVIDAQGNVYIASMLTPPDWSWPKAFGDDAPAPSYTWMYGSVVKFPATGGHFYYPPPRWGTPPADLIWPPCSISFSHTEEASCTSCRPGLSWAPRSARP